VTILTTAALVTGRTLEVERVEKSQPKYRKVTQSQGIALMMKGSYILLIPLPKGQMIKAGSLPEIYFPGGCYAYVGSAMGGFKSRLNRHHRKNKKPHWHIDYLLDRASIGSVILIETEARAECAIAQALSSQFDGVPGFGASDCGCRSHLFFSGSESQMKPTIMSILNSLATSERIHLVSPK